MADGTLIFDTQIDQAGFNKGANSLKKQGKTLEKSFGGLGKSLGKTALIAGAIAGFAKLGKEAINLASDMQEVQNVVDTAFGDMAYKMEEFAETSIQTFGMSKLTAKQTGSTFMAMAKGMGIASESASDMALQLTALTGDMSSFYNKTQDITSTALKSVFTGETETLKQFGIVMTEANLEAFRLSEGITTSYKAMSQAEKVQLRYNYVMHTTAMAQGDFAKTSGSWANQTRILSENFKELLSIIGSGLIKVLTPVVQALNLVIGKIIQFANAIAKVFGGKELEMQEQQAEAIQKSADAEEELEKNVKAVDKANKKSLAGFDTIMKLAEKTAESSGGDSGAGGGGISVNKPYNFELKATEDTSAIDNMTNNIKNRLNELVLYLNDIFSPAINTVFADIIPMLNEIGTEMFKTIQHAVNLIIPITQKIWKDGFEPALRKCVEIWSELAKSIKNTWDKWGATTFAKIRQALSGLADVFNLVWEDTIKPVWNNFMKNIDWLWTKHLKPFVDNFLDFVGVLVNGALDIYNGFLQPLIKWFWETFGEGITNSINTAVDVIFTFLGVISDVASGIITSLKGIIEYIVGVFTGDWERAWNGIKKYYKGLWDGIVGIVKGAVNLIIDFANGMIEAVRTVINYLIDALNKLSFDAPDWVEEKFGIESFGFNVTPIPEFKIPKLATGTVVPANNGEFLAMLGDNKRETEVVSPLSTMKQALMEAMRDYGGQNITISFEDTSIGDLVRTLKPYIDKENTRRGTRLVKGGI